jgi:hypothetical protein
MGKATQPAPDQGSAGGDRRRNGGAMQRALVTAASRGIGRVLVAELAGRGLEVVATARRVDDLADLPPRGGCRWMLPRTRR